MLQRDECKIDTLYSWPQQPVCLQARQVRFVKLSFYRFTFEVCHRGKEDRHVRRRKDQLIGGHSRNCGGSLGLKVDVFGEELVPFRSCRAKDDCSELARATVGRCAYSQPP